MATQTNQSQFQTRLAADSRLGSVHVDSAEFRAYSIEFSDRLCQLEERWQHLAAPAAFKADRASRG